VTVQEPFDEVTEHEILVPEAVEVDVIV